MKMSRPTLFAGLAAIAATIAIGAGVTTASVDRPQPQLGESCCCVEQDGELLCTITGEVLDECCCR
jgi:uncharacterized membrane protein